MSNEYDVIAGIYDPILYPALRSIRKSVLKELLPYADKSILDICCGTGNQLKLLARNSFTDLHCLDISNSMLEIARKNSSPFTCYHKDAADTDFADKTFDIAILSFAIHEKDWIIAENILKEAHRILKPEGRILIVDYIFDDKTAFFSKILIRIIERLAGKDHYRHFKNFISRNGLSNLIKNDRFKLVKSQRKFFNGITISMYEKILP